MLNKIKIKNKNQQIFNLQKKEFFSKNHKGQIGEMIEDVFSLLVVILLLAVLFFVAILFFNRGLTLKSETVTNRILNDKTDSMLNSIMRERQGENIIFSDEIRARDEYAKERLDQEIKKIKDQTGGTYGYYLYVIYHNAEEECAKTPEKATKTSCFFISNNPIAIKLTSVWGRKLM